jgi:hypothetical protein
MVIMQQLSDEERQFLMQLVEKGGPGPHEYKEFTAIVNNLEDEELEFFREVIGDSLNENTLIGHGFVKPFGYPGDFSIIHNIYQEYVNPDQKYTNWDRFFQDQAGAHAVRNRKAYFLKRCAEIDKRDIRKKRVLILGSGPATDFASSQNRQFKDSIDYFKDKHFVYMINKCYGFYSERVAGR